MATRRSSKGSNRIVVVIVIGAGAVAAAVAGAFVVPSLLSPRGESKAATAGLCQSLEIDGTGQIRDRGMIRCDKVVGRGLRMDRVRDSFSNR